MDSFFRRHKVLILIILGLSVYALIIVAMKLWVYPGWTWKGYISDLKTAVGLIFALCPPIFAVWRVYVQKTPEESLLQVLGRVIAEPVAARTAILLSIAIVCVVTAMLIFGESNPSPELLQSIDSGVWGNANDELKKLSGDPLRQNVVLSFATYERVTEAVEMARFDGSKLHEYRSIAKTFLQSGYNVDPLGRLAYYMIPLNSLSYAEASKGDFLNEPAPLELKEGQEQLQRILPSIYRKEWKAEVLEKLGELYLVDEKYSMARNYFQAALQYESERTQKALLTGFVANTLSGEGKSKEAAELYGQIFGEYPDTRKYIFLSNLGYFLYQAGEYDEAIDKIKAAINLVQQDWVSHLNLALVYEAKKQYEDAAEQYQSVITGAGANGPVPNPPIYRESLILMGRSAELAGKPFESFAGYYLEADTRSHSITAVNRLREDANQQSALYHDMAVLLRHTGTQGIDQFINWFEQRSQSLRPTAN